MADLATPSAAAISTLNAGADNTSKSTTSTTPTTSRPTRPDEDVFKVGLQEKESVLEKAKKKLADAQQRLNSSRNARSQTDPRQKELRDQLDTIKAQQAQNKASRQHEMDRIKTLDNQLKAKMNEQKTARAQIPFKSADDIDKEIQRLEKSVESGKLKLVEERKNVAEMSALRKQKKGFGAIDEREQEISRLKASIAEIKKQSDKEEYRQQQQDFDRIKKELDEFYVSKRDASKDHDAAFENLKKARAEQDQAWTDVKHFKDAHYNAKRQYHDYEREAIKAREAKRKAEKEAFLRSRRQEALERKLEEASMPAYGDEIRAAETVMRLLDPSSVPATTSTISSEFAAKASRTVDDAGIKGKPLKKKGDEEENYFVGTGGKKGKKNRRNREGNGDSGTTTAAATGKDVLGKLWAPGSIEQFQKLGVEPPSTVSDIPAVLDKVKDKRQFYLEDRDRKTKENIDTAQKEFDALEAETEKANGASPAPNGKATPDTRTSPDSTPKPSEDKDEKANSQ